MTIKNNITEQTGGGISLAQSHLISNYATVKYINMYTCKLYNLVLEHVYIIQPSIPVLNKSVTNTVYTLYTHGIHKNVNFNLISKLRLCLSILNVLGR